MPCGTCRVAAAIAAVEGLGLVLYAVLDVLVIVREGLTGPTEVSNVPAFIVQVLIFLALGVGLLVIARGWWIPSRSARAPFVLAQLLALVVGIPLAGTGGFISAVGVSLVVLAVAGVLLALAPATTRALAED